MTERIVVLAGSVEEAHRWLKDTVIIISDKHALFTKLKGINDIKLIKTGTYYSWLDDESEHYLDFKMSTIL